jgi:hypothetical protein
LVGESVCKLLSVHCTRCKFLYLLGYKMQNTINLTSDHFPSIYFPGNLLEKSKGNVSLKVPGVRRDSPDYQEAFATGKTSPPVFYCCHFFLSANMLVLMPTASDLEAFCLLLRSTFNSAVPRHTAVLPLPCTDTQKLDLVVFLNSCQTTAVDNCTGESRPRNIMALLALRSAWA